MANHMRRRASPEKSTRPKPVDIDEVAGGAFSPVQQILLDAAAERMALASQWLTADQVDDRLRSQPSGGEAQATRLRRQGLLLGVYVDYSMPSYRYPTWQFCPDGQPVEHLTEIIAVLRNSGVFQQEVDGLRRTTGWGEVEWFLSPHALLDGAAPAAKLSTEPARVLSAARIEFQREL